MLRAAIIILGLLAPPAHSGAQEALAFATLLRARPGVAAHLADLDESWLRIVVTFREDTDSTGLQSAMSAMFGGGNQPTLYFTQGKIVQVAGQAYLLAYAPHRDPPNFKGLTDLDKKSGTAGTSDVFDVLLPKLGTDATLGFSALNTERIAKIEDVRPFDLSREAGDRFSMVPGVAIEAAILFPVFAQARLKARQASSLSNLKQLCLGTLMYSQDFDVTLPPMTDLDVAKRAIYPYVKNDAIFTSPVTNEPYQPNVAASRKRLATIRNPEALLLFYEASPCSDGTRAAVFADGHAKRFKEAEWPRVKAASDMQANR